MDQMSLSHYFKLSVIEKHVSENSSVSSAGLKSQICMHNSRSQWCQLFSAVDQVLFIITHPANLSLNMAADSPIRSQGSACDCNFEASSFYSIW